MSFSKNENRLLQAALKDGRVSSYLNILKLSDNEAYEHSIDVATLTALCIDEMITVLECEYTEEECIEIVKGALLGVQIVKAADEPQVRQEKIGSLKWLVIGCCLGFGITTAAKFLIPIITDAIGE